MSALLKGVMRRGDIFDRKQCELINNTGAVLNKGDVVIIDKSVDTDNSAVAPSTVLLNNTSITAVYAGLLPLATGAYGFFDVCGKFLTQVSPQIASPTVQATGATTTNTSSSFAAGTYFVAYTYVNAAGETDVGTTESAAIVVAATKTLTITTPDPAATAGATKINVYITAAGGAAGSESFLLGTVAPGATTLAVTAPPTVVQSPPLTNTAGQPAGTLLKIGGTAATGGTNLVPWVADANSKVRVAAYNTLPSIKGTPVPVVMNGEAMASGYAATA